jgi:hypothetical protein
MLGPLAVASAFSALKELSSREATGTEDEELRGYGHSSSNAETMALKMAAAKFGALSLPEVTRPFIK